MNPSAIIEARCVSIAYGARLAVQEMDLSAREGQITLVLGHNGAGKTTLLRGMFGLLPIRSGSVLYRGRPIEHRPTRENVIDGIAFVPQGHGVFPRLTVDENLELGAYHTSDKATAREIRERIHTLFPILHERRTQKAGTMSGGQQQMVAIGIALMQSPSLLILDEPSIGLSPKLVSEVMQSIADIRDRLGISVLIVEQNIRDSAEIADHVVIMKTGRKVYDGDPTILDSHDEMMEFF